MSSRGREDDEHRSSLPRVPELDALLHDVDELRRTLETDLTLAASAVESGAPDLAIEILDADSAALHRFEELALDELSALREAPARRSRAYVHAGPILVAAALVGVLAGVLPKALGPHGTLSPESVAVTQNLDRIQELTHDGTPAQIRSASAALHTQLAQVLAVAATDPAAAQTALLMLSDEQNAILSSGEAGVLADVLRQARTLAAEIRAAMPHSQVVVAPPAAPSADPSPSAKPAAQASKPSASPAAHPSASPTPSPSQSNVVVFPTTPSAP